MFGEDIKREIEVFTQHFFDKNPFACKAKQGELTKNHIARYLKNILYSIEFTPIHLKAASSRSRELGLNNIAQFMDDKYIEEFGHDKWVKSDLSKLGVNSEIQNNNELTQGMVELMKFVESLVYGETLYYIAYITFVEYFTVLAAPELLDCIENKCEIPRSSLTVVANHGELDKIHIEDDLKAIAKFVDSPEKSSEFIKVIRKTAELVYLHFSECAELA